jgi:prolyl oligopeptidase
MVVAVNFVREEQAAGDRRGRMGGRERVDRDTLWRMKIYGITASMLPLIVVASAFAAETPDPYLWLEQVDSPRAMEWVRKENDKTTAVLEKDPRYASLYKDALKIAEAKDRVPVPKTLDGAVYNFWQDSEHVRGIWRRTTLQSYRLESPQWTAVLDLDALAIAEKANWFLKNVDCTEPLENRCMLDLSDGGEDAVTSREFDVPSKQFVKNGFLLPHGKQTSAWEDANTLLVAREWVPGDLTSSGYPFVVKRLTRGQPLSAAREIFRGTKDDGGYGVSPLVLHDSDGHRATIIQRPLTTFESEFYLVSGNKTAQLAIPRKSQIQDLIDGQLIVSLAEDWTPSGGAVLAQGCVIALDLRAITQDPEHLKPTLVYAPGARESFDALAATHSALIVTISENVKGRAFVYRRAGSAWKRRQLDLPDNATIGIADTSIHSDDVFLSVAGFLQPSSLWLLDVNKGEAPAKIKTLPPKFDASHDVVEQFQAKSSDGTEIPYFIVHSTGMKLDGNNPTILNAYGGFQISSTPVYSATSGKLWLENGGVFVLANIRGGGEFGPVWHEAGLKTHRQIIYDDFTAVARDLIARKITSPRHLGIQGGSNGGLLMGVEYTQHPELWNAVDIQVPLLDMLRFEKIAAGTSWVGEYGSISNPDEAAFLAHISPYNNIKKGVTYPEAFIWTTTKDDRVGPQHARKFAARLSEYGIPYLFYEVTEGGHGSGANLKEKAHTSALEMTYFTSKLMD